MVVWATYYLELYELWKPILLFQDYFLVMFDMNQETENVVSGIFKTLNLVYVPALQACKAWGDINPPNPNSVDIIKSYISKIMLFIDYLASKSILLL